MNGIDSATLGTLTRVVKHFEDAALDTVDVETWSAALMIVAPYKAALVESAAFSRNRELVVRYLRAAQLTMQGRGLDDLIGATEGFATALECFDDTPRSLERVRHYGNELQSTAGFVARSL